ncbi:6-bladed beta-propeller [Poriferisphaera sp. WC338]|uniref:6-bladed beta-propeller n=1 Tax=Poriferisphaera sp. WC338 TaxID=3425129 RepID=UPI003D812EFF
MIKLARQREEKKERSVYALVGHQGLAVMFCVVMGLVGCDGHGAQPVEVKANRVWNMPADSGRIPGPRSATANENGEVLVLDNGGRVLFFNNPIKGDSISGGGEVIRTWWMPTNKDGNPEGGTWLRDGRVVVADTHYFRLVFFNAAGEIDEVRGERGKGPGQFEFPVCVRQDEQTGELYVAEYGGNDRIQVFSEAGEYLRVIGKPGVGPGEFQRAADLVLHGDLVYVADAINGRVHVFKKDGTFLRMVGQKQQEDGKVKQIRKGVAEEKTYDEKAGAGRDVLRGTWGELLFDYPYGIAIGGKPGEARKLYVIEWGGGRYVRVDLETEEVEGVYGKPGSGEGEFRTPWGIAVDVDGDVIVADTENRRVVEVVEE